MKTPEEIKKALKACNKEPISLRNCAAECPYHVGTFSCLWDLRKDALAYIEQLEEQIMCMKIQMHGDCGICKHRHNSKKRKDGPSFIGPCWTCVHDESRPNWEYEGLPELPKKGESA